MSNAYVEQLIQQPIDCNFFSIQVVVLGAYNVGKTTLLKKFCLEKTPQHIFHTIGIQFIAKTFIHNHKTFRLKFWDTSGDPKFRNLAFQHIPRASAVLLVYDLTSYETFHEANEWVNQLYEMQKDLPILLFGNKHDLLFQNTIMKNQKREVNIRHLKKVTEQEGRQLAEKIGAVWIQGCGKTDNNLQKGLRLLLDKYFMQDNIVLENEQVKSGCFCC